MPLLKTSTEYVCGEKIVKRYNVTPEGSFWINLPEKVATALGIKKVEAGSLAELDKKYDGHIREFLESTKVKRKVIAIEFECNASFFVHRETGAPLVDQESFRDEDTTWVELRKRWHNSDGFEFCVRAGVFEETTVNGKSGRNKTYESIDCGFPSVAKIKRASITDDTLVVDWSQHLEDSIAMFLHRYMSFLYRASKVKDADGLEDFLSEFM